MTSFCPALPYLDQELQTGCPEVILQPQLIFARVSLCYIVHAEDHHAVATAHLHAIAAPANDTTDAVFDQLDDGWRWLGTSHMLWAPARRYTTSA